MALEDQQDTAELTRRPAVDHIFSEETMKNATPGEDRQMFIKNCLSKRARKRMARVLSRDTPGTPARQRKSPFWRRLLAVVCSFVAAAVLTYAFFEYWLPGKVPSALVGKWAVQGGEQAGVTLEFRRHGAFQARVNVGGKMGGVDGRAEVEGDNLRIFSVNPQTGIEEAKTHLIKKLTETELILQDPTGISSTMVRLD
jgi:uncharacterized protein (TIGR03066 family)